MVLVSSTETATMSASISAAFSAKLRGDTSRHDPPLRGDLARAQERRTQRRHHRFHGIGGEHHLGQEDLAALEALADLPDAGADRLEHGGGAGTVLHGGLGLRSRQPFVSGEHRRAQLIEHPSAPSPVCSGSWTDA
jgi:hypothetical protein